MLSANSAFVLKTGSADGSQHFEKLPTNSGMIGTDENGNPIDRSSDMYKVKVDSSDPSADYLEAKVADSTDVQWTATDDHSKIDSIVYQLTGLGARLVAKDTGSFQWVGATYGSTLGGRGICSGRVYLSGVDTQVWACNDGVGAIYKTLDDWKTIITDQSWMTFMGGDPISYHVQPPCIKFVYSSHLSSYMWVITHWPGYGPYYYSYALHTPSNYNSDGTLKSTAWVTVECPQVMADIGVGPDNVALFVGNHDKVYRTTDWNTWTLVYTAPSSHVIGGIDTDGYGNWIIVERDYGVVHISQDNGLTWTTPSIYVRNTEEGEYAPASNLGTAGAVVAGNGIWLVASGSAYNYSTDGIYWTRYVTSLGSFYGMGFDGVKFFATNPMVAQTTKIWQLLVSEIPAHRHLVAEEGITVDKAAYLPFLPSATSLATDAMGKVVEGTAITEVDLGTPPADDYVLAKPSGNFQWIPRDGYTGVVEAPIPDLIRNGGAGTITVPAMKIQAYYGSEFFGNPVRYQTVETTLNVPDGGNAYYVAFKDDMGPTIYITSDKSSLNMSNRIPLYIVSRIGTTIHTNDFDTQGVGLPQKSELALLNTTPYKRSVDGGLIISEDGSRHISLTSGVVYSGTTAVDVLAYDSNLSNNLLTRCYHVAGVWNYSTTSAGNGQYDNTQYDNGTDLVTLDNNKYKIVWVFRSIGDDKEIFTVAGNAQYSTIADAQLAQVPAIPPVVAWHCMLVGRIIVQKNANSGIVQSAFDQTFSAAPVTSHNNLSNLQGGTTSEYYHLTNTEHTAVQNLPTMFASLKDPTGWDDNENIAVSYNGTTRQITLSRVSGNLKYWWNGSLVDLGATSWTSSAHTNTAGSWYLYSTDGVNFAWSNTMWAFNTIMVAAVDYQSATKFICLKETHGLMQWTSHRDLHLRIGTGRNNTTETGGTVNGYVLSSAAQADRRPGATAVDLLDEDLVVALTALSSGGTYSHFALSSGSAMDYSTAEAEIVHMSGTTPQYQNPSTGAWSNIGNNNYANMYLVAVPATADATSQSYRWMWLQAQATYTTLTSAMSESMNGLNLGNLKNRFAEFLFAARVTIKQNATSYFSIENVTQIYGSLQSQIAAGGSGSTSPTIYDAVVNNESELLAALQSSTVQSIFVRSNTPFTLSTPVTVGASKRIYGGSFTLATTVTNNAFTIKFFNTSIALSSTSTIANTTGGTVQFGRLTGAGTINSTVASYYEFAESTVTIGTAMFQGYWDNTYAAYDAIVRTSADLQAALESSTITSIYIRTGYSGDIVLGSGTADQTITLGSSKNLYGQPFRVGSSSSYITTIALGTYTLRARNDRIDVYGKLTFTGTGTAYVKKLLPNGSSNLVVGVAGKLIVENVRTPAAVSNATINMWDMPLRSGSASSISGNQVLRYNSSTGEWDSVTIEVSAPFGQELYSYSISETTGSIGSDGNIDTNCNATTRGFAFVPNGTVTITKMRIMVTQVGGTYFRLGIYDASGNLVGKSERYATSNGLKEVNLTLGPSNASLTSVTLTGGSIYYMAYWTDDTTQNFKTSLLSGRSTSTAQPLMQRHSATNQEMPDSLGSGASNTALRPWLMISG